MRIPFVLAMADNMAIQIINNVGAMEYLPPLDNGDRHYPALRLTVNGYSFLFMVHKLANNIPLPWTSAAASENWDVFFLLPADSLSYTVGCKLYRAMRNFILSARNRNAQNDWYMQGPWSIVKIAQAYPEFAHANLEVLDADGEPTGVLKVPIMFSGDSEPTLVAQIDYSPSDEDCSNDVEPEEGSLY